MTSQLGSIAAPAAGPDKPVVIDSIDIDVLDPAFAPGTGTPEIGGFSTRELAAILRGFQALPIVCVDVVEVAPAYDHAEVTALAAANIAYDVIAMMAPSRDESRENPRTKAAAETSLE